MDIPEHIQDLSADGYLVMRRVPGSYLGVVSGLARTQYPTYWVRAKKNPPQQPLWEGADGVLVGLHHEKDVRSPIRIAKILDGTSKTVMLGEAVSDFEILQQVAGAKEEDVNGNRNDHWYGGSDDIDTDLGQNDDGEAFSWSDPSEFLRINRGGDQFA